jgi:hypothetical protein
MNDELLKYRKKRNGADGGIVLRMCVCLYLDFFLVCLPVCFFETLVRVNDGE